MNPLHIDPEVSQMVGFEKPILHGLCTYGIAALAVYDKFCDGDINKVHKVMSRFTSHVFPGEKLIIEMWKYENDGVYYEVKTQERGLTAMKGYIKLRS